MSGELAVVVCLSLSSVLFFFPLLSRVNFPSSSSSGFERRYDDAGPVQKRLFGRGFLPPASADRVSLLASVLVFSLGDPRHSFASR